jgi:hypothetical protein
MSKITWRCAGCGIEVIDAIQTCACTASVMCPSDGSRSRFMHRRDDFATALNDFLQGFAKDSGISWDEAIYEMEVKISHMREELRRSE